MQVKHEVWAGMKPSSLHIWARNTFSVTKLDSHVGLVSPHQPRLTIALFCCWGKQGSSEQQFSNISACIYASESALPADFGQLRCVLQNQSTQPHFWGAVLSTSSRWNFCVLIYIYILLSDSTLLILVVHSWCVGWDGQWACGFLVSGCFSTKR